jgi:hypothetical protein
MVLGFASPPTYGVARAFDVVDAARHEEPTLTNALLPRWRRAADSGHADDDLAVIYTTP